MLRLKNVLSSAVQQAVKVMATPTTVQAHLANRMRAEAATPAPGLLWRQGGDIIAVAADAKPAAPVKNAGPKPG